MAKKTQKKENKIPPAIKINLYLKSKDWDIHLVRAVGNIVWKKTIDGDSRYICVHPKKRFNLGVIALLTVFEKRMSIEVKRSISEVNNPSLKGEALSIAKMEL